jgi:hypothetical protein
MPLSAPHGVFATQIEKHLHASISMINFVEFMSSNPGLGACSTSQMSVQLERVQA